MSTTSQIETPVVGQNNGKPVTDRQIDFPRLTTIALSSGSEVLGAAVYALEQWERCDGRKWSGFHDLLNAVERELEPLSAAESTALVHDELNALGLSDSSQPVVSTNPLMPLKSEKTKGGYRLTREKTGQTLDVTDPYWK